jgi:hypothetical protein
MTSHERKTVQVLLHAVEVILQQTDQHGSELAPEMLDALEQAKQWVEHLLPPRERQSHVDRT